jgi:hypothetical protein
MAGVIVVRCESQSITNRRVKVVKLYTAETIDWLAVWDRTVDRCFYIPAAELGTGMNRMHIRLAAAQNHQVRGIRPAERYTTI